MVHYVMQISGTSCIPESTYALCRLSCCANPAYPTSLLGAFGRVQHTTGTEDKGSAALDD